MQKQFLNKDNNIIWTTLAKDNTDFTFFYPSSRYFSDMIQSKSMLTITIPIITLQIFYIHFFGGNLFSLFHVINIGKCIKILEIVQEVTCLIKVTFDHLIL